MVKSQWNYFFSGLALKTVNVLHLVACGRQELNTSRHGGDLQRWRVSKRNDQEAVTNVMIALECGSFFSAFGFATFTFDFELRRSVSFRLWKINMLSN